MTDLKEKKNIPKLRFSGFEQEWETKRIKEIVSFLKDGTHSSFKNDPSGEHFLLSAKNIRDGSIKLSESERRISKKSYEEITRNYKLREGDILLTIVGTIGRCAIYNNGLLRRSAFQRSVAFFRFDNYDSFFIYHYFNSVFFQSELKRRKVISAQPGIYLNDLSKIDLRLPQKEEQEKIASFLTTVDEKISLLEKQKKQWQKYKKGSMQKIFSQQMRFTDDNGNQFPDWREKKLGEIGVFQTSSVNKKTMRDEKEIYLVNYMNVYRHENINNQTVKDFQVVTAKDSQISSSNLLRGDILFTPSSETPTDIGHSVVIFEDIKNAVFSYHLMRFRPKIDLDLMYAHYFCNIPSVLKQLSRFATGSTRFTISVGNFSKVVVSLPTKPEQQKIASSLSDLDTKIEMLDKKITQSREWKKGLLQKMFV